MGSIVSDVVGIFTGAGDVEDAANASAAQQREAAQNAAYSAAFRPVGMTSRFGTSQFTREIDPKTGTPYVSSAGYTPAPELSALQNRLFGQFGPSMATAEQRAGQYAPLGGAANRLMSLGEGYLAQSPEAAAQDYMRSQQGLLAGTREQQLSQLRNKVFQTGRSGLGVGATTTGQGASNPEMQAYYNALANQDLQLASQAQQAGQQRATFGAGLYGTGAGLLGTQIQGEVGALSPLQSQLGLASNIEQLGQTPYNMGLALGTASVPGQTTGAQLYGQGMSQAAQTQYAGAQQAAQLNAAFLNNLIGSAAGAYGMSSMGGGASALGGGLSTGTAGGYMGGGNYLTGGVNFPTTGFNPTAGGWGLTGGKL
jgi:hypothetical protein